MNATSQELSRVYQGETATLRTARRDVVDFLLECGANGQTVEQASLIVSELASNAIQAAPGIPYELHLRIVDLNAVSLSIKNRTNGAVPPAQPSWRPTDDLAVSGRGLSIVDSLSDEVAVEVDGDEVTVTAWFQLIGP